MSNRESSYNFMRTGMSVSHTSPVLHSDELQLMRAVILSFAEDAVQMASLYIRGQGLRQTIDVETIIKCLKARAIAGVRMDGDGFHLRVGVNVDRLAHGTANTANGTTHTPMHTMHDAQAMVLLVDRMSVEYDSWEPIDLIHQSFKIGIDRASVRFSKDAR
jgi:hypothetical protein